MDCEYLVLRLDPVGSNRRLDKSA